MVNRKFWLKKIEKAWKHRSIIWLSGVRRVGKTYLSLSVPDVEYFDCELPRTRKVFEDPEGFLESLGSKKIIIDEIHRLANPSEILKIAADHYPHIKILATGSSTLGVTSKFKDTLTGRKNEIWLTPAISEDLNNFKLANIQKRFLRGGLPPFFLSKKILESDFQEWIDSYWAKDIQELFRIERRYSFQKFFELIMVQSGGIFEASSFTSSCEVSRTTITNYLKVLEATYIASVIRPFHTHRPTEIVAAPKVYGFDTGFVCFFRGWDSLRQQDLGILWEHYVLNEIQAQLQSRQVLYWRDKRGHEIDFVLVPRGQQKSPIAIECKWSAKQMEYNSLKSFLNQYPKASCYVVAQDVKRMYIKTIEKSKVKFVSLSMLISELSN